LYTIWYEAGSARTSVTLLGPADPLADPDPPEHAASSTTQAAAEVIAAGVLLIAPR
jgi:hypothetical protein